MAVDVHRQCRDAVAETIKTWDLIDESRVHAIDQFRPDLLALPCIAVTFEAGAESMRGGTNCRDDFAFPLLVSLHDTGRPLGDDSGGVQMGPDPIAFRQKVREVFHMRQPSVVLATVPELLWSEYSGQAVIDPSNPLFQHLKTAVTITCVCRVARG